MKTSTQVKAGQTVTDLLKGHDRGRTEHDISQKLTEMIQKVREHKRGGSLTITISAALVKNDPDRLYITVEKKLKAPEKAPPTDIRYADDDGSLHERDPRQMDYLQPQ